MKAAMPTETWTDNHRKLAASIQKLQQVFYADSDERDISDMFRG